MSPKGPSRKRPVEPLLILGGTGMLGHKLWQVLSPRFDTHLAARAPYEAYEPFGIFDRARWHGGVDAEQPETVLSVIERVKPALVINCIGVIKQLPAAKDAAYAIRVNSLYPHLLHQMTREAGAHLVHVSTDCVFSGRRGQYDEADLPDPGDLYGRSKLLGEIDAEDCLTLRTSIIGRELHSSYGLVEWFLSQRQGPIRGFSRAIYTGMPTVTLSLLLADLLDKGDMLSGLYHAAVDPISKYDLLVHLRDAYGIPVAIERDEAFECDRSLRAERFWMSTGLVRPTWPEMIATMVADSTPYGRWRQVA